MKDLRKLSHRLLGSWRRQDQKKDSGEGRRRVLTLETLEGRLVPATLTWTGATNPNWSEAGNWIGGVVPTSGQNDILVFNSSTGGLQNFQSNNDIPGLSIAQIQIVNNSATNSWLIGGLEVSMSGQITHDGAAANPNDIITLTNIEMLGNFSITSNASSPLTINSFIDTNGGTLTVNNVVASPINFNGEISGSGSFTKSSGGQVNLNAANQFTGALTVAGGILAVNNGSAIADPVAVQVNAGSTLLLNASETVGSIAGAAGSTLNLGNFTLTAGGNNNSSGFSGVITGTGGLVKVGTGTMTLQGNNNYSGGTTITGGTLAGTTTSLPGDIVNNASLAFIQAAPGTYAGVISGTGNVGIVGSATLVFSNVNTYTGTTTINSGTLIVDGSIVSNTTANGGALGGEGNVANVQMNSPAVLNPGNPLATGTGTLTTANLTLNQGSVVSILIAGAGTGEFDRIAANGTVSLGNATLTVSTTTTPFIAPLGTVIDILLNDGADAIVGTFNNLPEGAVIAVNANRYQISYVGGDGNDVTLTAISAPAAPSFSGGILKIFGTGAADTILLNQNGRQGFNGVNVTINGDNFGTFNLVNLMLINTLGNNDRIVFANDVRIPMKIDGGEGGADTLDFSAVQVPMTVYVGRDLQLPDEAAVFIGVERIIGGLAGDTFIVGSDPDKTGSLNGGGSVNNLDLSRSDAAVTVDLLNGLVDGRMSIANFQVFSFPIFQASTLILTNGAVVPSFGGTGGQLPGDTFRGFTPLGTLEGPMASEERTDRSESSSDTSQLLDDVLESELEKAKAEETDGTEAVSDAEETPSEPAKETAHLSPSAVDLAFVETS